MYLAYVLGPTMLGHVLTPLRPSWKAYQSSKMDAHAYTSVNISQTTAKYNVVLWRSLRNIPFLQERKVTNEATVITVLLGQRKI